MTAPVRVMVEMSTARLMPKSVTLAVPSASMRMF